MRCWQRHATPISVHGKQGLPGSLSAPRFVLLQTLRRQQAQPEGSPTAAAAQVVRHVASDATAAAGLLASAQGRAAQLAARLSRSHSVVAVLEAQAAAGNTHLKEMQVPCPCPPIPIRFQQPDCRPSSTHCAPHRVRAALSRGWVAAEAYHQADCQTVKQPA